MDRSGNLILKKPVKLAQNFSEELAFVYDEFYYCVDRSGNLRFQLDKNCVYVEPFQNGMALIQFSNGKYSYINQEGLMMSYQFDKAFSFYNGMAYVEFNNVGSYINKMGEICIENANLAEGIPNLKSGDYTTYHAGERKLGIKDSEGTITAVLNVDGIEKISGGLVCVRDHEQIGFVDMFGSFVIPFDDFSLVYPYDNFGDDCILVEQKGKMSWINKKGKHIISFPKIYFQTYFDLDSKVWCPKFLLNPVNSDIKVSL